jgi:hypothetical protein
MTSPKQESARSRLRLCSLLALLLGGACGSSPAGMTGGHAGTDGAPAGTGGSVADAGGDTGAAGGGAGEGGAGVAVSCTSSDGCEVGPSGATISMGIVTLTIPEGALATPVKLVIYSTFMTVPDYALASTVYQFGPQGTTFAHPATVAIPLNRMVPVAHLFWSNASGGFDDLGGMKTGNTLTGQVTHFSYGFAAEPRKTDGGATDAAASADDAAADVASGG